MPSTVSASGNVDANLPEPVPIEHAYLLIVRLTDDIIADIHSKRKVEEHHLHQSASINTAHRHSPSTLIPTLCHALTALLLCLLCVVALRLYSLYGGTLEKALSIVDVDGGNVTLVRAELTGRFLFQVVGSDVRPYTATMHHCSCPAYTNTVVLSTDSLYVSAQPQPHSDQRVVCWVTTTCTDRSVSPTVPSVYCFCVLSSVSTSWLHGSVMHWAE